jgi:mannose/cellobiose epimerase-like protein (N-acyl-D-glucosamine 2-epimerase family)
MNKYEADIELWIQNKYPDAERAKKIIEPLLSIDTAVSLHRIIRSALYLSESDYDSLASYTQKALDDPRNVLWWAEYDNRNVQKRDFNYSLFKQKPS